MTESTTPHSRLLAWNACCNTRELGGYLTASQHPTRWNAFIRSDSLHRLNEAGQAALIAYGVQTIIDLRTREEVQSAPSALMHISTQTDASPMPVYHHISILDSTDKSWQKEERAINTMADLYGLMLDGLSVRFAKVMKTIANAAPGTIAFYCHAGKDRTGLVAALLLSLADVPAETIIADYAGSDLHLEPVYTELREAAANDPEKLKRYQWLLQCLPETMQGTLEHLDARYGGAENYLLQNGVTPEEIAQIRARLIG